MNKIYRQALVLFAISLTIIIESFGQGLQTSFDQYEKLKDSTPYRLEWISAGPVLNSARAEAVQAHPEIPGTLYAAFGSGGLWKSSNDGLSWKPVFENKPSLGIGDFALAPSNPSIIYLGTGESLRKARNFTMPGNGVYKSNNGGESWKHLGLEDSWHIGEIVVHPSNPDIVLVAVLGKFWSESKDRGIYRTENGGVTWEHVLYVDENTGANDIVIAQSNPDIIYASTWEFKAEVRGDKNYNNTGAGSAVYRSKDGGKTWEICSNGLPAGDKIGRSGVAVSYQNPEKAYWFVDNQNNKSGETGEVYKTIDGGDSWVKTNTEPLKLLSVVNWYFMDLYVSPNNDEEIYSLGVRVAHSSDGGKSFKYLAGDVSHINPSAAQGLHLDHCELWINPNNPNNLLLANDGGVYASLDKGKSWLHYNNIPTGEFYDITLDYQTPYNIYGGVQDDATVFGPAKEWNSNRVDPWKYLWIDPWNGGDGCITQIDPTDSNIIYYSAQEGAVRRLNRATGSSKRIRPRLVNEEDNSLKFNFITPYLISHYNSNTLYHAGNYIFKSENKGDDWKVISPDLALKEKGKRGSNAAGAFAESKLTQGLLYMGSDHGAFWVTKDDGHKWTEFSKGLPDAYIRSVSPSVFNKERVYIAMTGLNYDDLNAYLFVSEDYGKSWKSIKSNLPNEPMNKIVEDQTNENIIYAGGYRGVYVSLDRGNSWEYLGKGMPAASISDIEFHDPSQEIVVSTHGRGVYYLDIAPIRHRAQIVEQLQLHIYQPKELKAPSRSIPGGGIDPREIEKLPITFNLPDKGNYTLSILIDDETIWSVSDLGSKGLNQIRWNMVVGTEESDQPYFIHYTNYAQAGEYKLVLEFEGNSEEVNFKLTE